MTHPMDDHTGFDHPEHYDCDCCGEGHLKSELVHDADYEEFVCVSCIENRNEAAYDRHQEWLMETGGGPSLIEQQQAAYKIKHGLR